MTFDDHTQRLSKDIHDLQRMGLIEQTPAGCWTLTPAGFAAVEQINNEQDERPFALTAKGRATAAHLLDNKD